MSKSIFIVQSSLYNPHCIIVYHCIGDLPLPVPCFSAAPSWLFRTSCMTFCRPFFRRRFWNSFFRFGFPKASQNVFKMDPKWNRNGIADLYQETITNISKIILQIIPMESQHRWFCLKGIVKSRHPGSSKQSTNSLANKIDMGSEMESKSLTLW